MIIPTPCGPLDSCRLRRAGLLLKLLISSRPSHGSRHTRAGHSRSGETRAPCARATRERSTYVPRNPVLCVRVIPAGPYPKGGAAKGCKQLPKSPRVELMVDGATRTPGPVPVQFFRRLPLVQGRPPGTERAPRCEWRTARERRAHQRRARR